MKLEHHTEDGIEIVRLPSRLLMANARDARKALQSMVRNGHVRLAIDMSAVEHIDSSGLAVLVNCLQSSRKRRGDVCLYGMSEQVRTLFELTRLHDVFPIEDGHRAAAERLAA